MAPEYDQPVADGLGENQAINAIILPVPALSGEDSAVLLQNRDGTGREVGLKAAVVDPDCSTSVRPNGVDSGRGFHFVPLLRTLG